MTDMPFSWLDDAIAADGRPADDDPWGDVDLEEAGLTDAQEEFLASFADQPAIPRVRHLGDPLAAFEEDDVPPTES